MFKRNYWVRSGAYSMLQRVAGFLFGFGSYFFLVRYFDIDDFGVWTLYVVVSTAIEMSRSAFIQNAFVKFFNEEGTNKDALVCSSFILNFISTLVFIGILVALIPVLQSYWKAPMIGVLILWYCATSIILIPFTQLNYLEQASHSFSGVFWSMAVRQGAFFFVVIGAYFFYPGLPLTFFAGAHFFCALMGLMVAFILTRKFMPNHYFFDWPEVKRLFKFGKYILGTGVTSSIGKNTDQFILGGAGHSTVALYNSVIRILNFIEIPSLAISNIVYPKIAERASKEGKASVAQLYEKSVASILGIIAPIVLVAFLFPELILVLTAGHQYAGAANILRVMSIAALLIPFNIQIGTVCEVINKPQIGFFINLSSSILSVILNLILIKIMGITGAALAWSLTIGSVFIFGQWYVTVNVGVRIRLVFTGVINFYKQILFIGLNYIKRGHA